MIDNPQLYTKYWKWWAQKVITVAFKRGKQKTKRRASARLRRAAMKDVMDSVGLKRVKGNLGGTYYE